MLDGIDNSHLCIKSFSLKQKAEQENLQIHTIIISDTDI